MIANQWDENLMQTMVSFILVRITTERRRILSDVNRQTSIFVNGGSIESSIDTRRYRCHVQTCL